MQGSTKSLRPGLESRFYLVFGHPFKLDGFVINNGILVGIDLVDDKKVIFFATNDLPIVNSFVLQLEVELIVLGSVNRCGIWIASYVAISMRGEVN